MSVAYLYDGSFYGLLSAVFQAYARKEDPVEIQEANRLQTAFGQVVVEIATDEDKAKRVERGIVGKLGSPAWQTVWTAYLSCDPDRGTVIYRYVRVALELGRLIYSHLSHPAVLAIDKVCRYTQREAHLMQEFVRFARMENGVYYSRINPNTNVLPLIMPHFADRFGDQPLLIFDPGHATAGVYDLREWYLVDTESLALPPFAQEEREYQRLWKSFYDHIAIKERFNPKCRRNHMPKRFWSNMVEMRGEK